MPKKLTPQEKAWVTRRKILTPQQKAVVAEAASKEALRTYCKKSGVQLAFFEAKTGAPRTGIIKAVVFMFC